MYWGHRPYWPGQGYAWGLWWLGQKRKCGREIPEVTWGHFCPEEGRKAWLPTPVFPFHGLLSSHFPEALSFLYVLCIALFVFSEGVRAEGDFPIRKQEL